jgi:ATP-dependent DNA helicase RecG
MKITDLLKQPEGRRLEFKESMPVVAELARTIVAFANDAGGELYIGVKDKPREFVGVSEDDLFKIEEQISNIIHDQCYPIIIPDISFVTHNNAQLIRIQIHKGSNLPYYVKSKGKTGGTYIRIGSSNRLADAEMIAELERQKRNISFDSELVFDKPFQDLQLTGFKALFQEKTGEIATDLILRKLGLIKEFQGALLPTNALVLFSDVDTRTPYFPYAKVECARFKGITSETFIDQKTIDTSIALQAEIAYDFVLRHINEGAIVKGVYTQKRWEYPVKAVREALRNAVVHRDYSLSGKDIKVAIYDDMIEITSPGKLLPSIDYNELEARQSDIRNKIIAPVFKKMGIIDQWGNGLKLIADELKNYPNIELKWSEIGAQFQLQFVNKAFDGSETNQPSPETGLGLEELAVRLGIDLGHDTQSEELSAENGTRLKFNSAQLGPDSGLSTTQLSPDSGLSITQLSPESGLSTTQLSLESGLSWYQLGTKLALSQQHSGNKSILSWIQLEDLLVFCESVRNIQEMMSLLDWQNRTKFRNKYLKILLELKLLQMTVPDKPNSSKQKYYTTQMGKDLLKSKLG